MCIYYLTNDFVWVMICQDHAQENVPVVVSSQGNNGSTQNQAIGTNVQVNQSASTSTNTSKVYDIRN